MERWKYWPQLLIFALLTLSLQSCLSDINQTSSQNGQVTITSADQASFRGKIYFVANHIIYRLDGADQAHMPHPLTPNSIEAHDPAVSPDGKQIAFIARHQPDYSDLMLMNADGSNIHTLRSGKGGYTPNPYSDMPKSTYVWYAQPVWHPDGKHLAFLSDLGKPYMDAGKDAFLLDPQIYLIALDDPAIARPQPLAYTDFGGGGLRDPGFRPTHPDQLIYTSYRYDDKEEEDLYTQIYLEDPNAITNNPTKYDSGYPANDPAVHLTPQGVTVINREPAFSPDGKTILYTRREDSSHMSIYAMPVAEHVTTSPMTPDLAQKALAPYNQSAKLMTAQYLSFPTWSPDGRQMAYVGYANSAFDIWLASLVKDSKAATYSVKAESAIQLTNAGGQLDSTSRPCWVP